MSIPVDLDALRGELSSRERPAYLITAGDGPPHLVSVFLRWVDDAFQAPCGKTTARNLAQNDAVSVVVPPNENGGYSLIFDATGQVLDETVRLVPSHAVLHRPATAPDESGSCPHDCAPVGDG